MHTFIYPADPDCPKCHGNGNVSVYGGKGETAWLSISSCNCRLIQNLEKIRSRCQHEMVCKKCGTTCGGRHE